MLQQWPEAGPLPAWRPDTTRRSTSPPMAAIGPTSSSGRYVSQLKFA
ncbi:MAG: hypothetical protein RIK87_06640 [Fuerstiella sp.]